MPDAKLARRIKRSRIAVGTRRAHRGIPPLLPKHKTWRAEDDKVLGTRPDTEIALLLRRTVLSVMHRRLRLGIPNRWSKKVRRPWTAADDKLLGSGSRP